MDEQQKERLEQELRFLKESLEADVISKDEYEKGKERIKRKLKELEEQKESKEIEEKPEEKLEEAEEKEGIEEELQKPKIEIKEIKERPTKIIGAEEEEPEEEIKEPEEEPEEEEKEPIAEEKEPKEEPEEEIKISKKWLYGIAIIIIAILIFFSIRSCNKQEEPSSEAIEEFIPECSSDSDCKQQGMVGICQNPGTKEAKCEFKQDAKTNLIVINDKDCKLCDSSNTKTIIKEIFPNVNIKEIDYEAEEAKKLINQFNINALPAYIFDSNITKTINYNDFKTALIKKGDGYIITNTASGANYYLKRPLIQNKLDIYFLPETTEKIESNIEEVSNLFKDKLNFTKHIVTERQKGLLEKELAINTYPTFLLNNQFKFRGILPANMIKEKICQVNYFEECEKELSKI